MDLSNLSTDVKLLIFRRTKYNVLPRVRMASKSIDCFIEKYRHAISKHHFPQALYIQLSSRDQPLDWQTETGYFYLDVGSARVEIKDPYRELSPFLFKYILITRSNEEIPRELKCPTPVYPALMKIKPRVFYIHADNLSADETLKLAEIVRSKGLVVRKSDKCGLERILKNTIVQNRRFIIFDECWSNEDTCSMDFLRNLTVFRHVYLFNIHTTFIKTLIEHLRVLPNWGRIENIQIRHFVNVFNDVNSDPPPNHLLWASANKWAFIRVIDAVNVWIIVYERIEIGERKMNVFMREKDPLSLLRVLTEKVLGARADDSGIREEFVNAPDMEERRKIFQSFYERNYVPRRAKK